MAAAPSAANAADGCNQNTAKTARSTSVWSRTIELRANTNNVCGWGRISNGDPGDLVWVDRSYDGGAHWEQLSITTIPTNSRTTFTAAYNDQGHLMRACGKAGNRPEVACTGWW
ncbi:glycosyl hydrolase [Fodinicola feengrottensis]|uniref:glycosyl hydrolase n=1 Tax=Fodinicola feengrottensis TaxID=435914 RepID=UPI0013CF5D8C|nr:glycosyl hydrolase [Fodinicola feengrottensis]